MEVRVLFGALSKALRLRGFRRSGRLLELTESVTRGEVVVVRSSFAQFWQALVEAKRPYLTAGALEDLETHGRKRLLPFFGARSLGEIDEQLVRPTKWRRPFEAPHEPRGRAASAAR